MFKFLLFTILTIGTKTTIVDGNGTVDITLQGYTYLPLTGGYYRYIAETRWYSYALARCLVTGGTLWAPKSREESKAVFDLFNIPSNQPIWINAHIIPEFGFDGRTCPIMWRDLKIELTGESPNRMFVCKNIDRPKIGRQREIDMYVAKNYTYIKVMNAMYKFYSSPASLYEPAVQCTIDDAELFLPNSYLESIYVFDLIPMEYGKIWVGATKYLTGEFTTFHGKPFLSKISLNADKDYVVLNRDRLFETADWDDKKPYVCKRILDTSELDTVSPQCLPGYTTLSGFPQFPGTYKSHTRNRWYSYAVARCYVEGGILFTPTSIEELHAVFTHIAIYSKDIWISSPFTPLRDHCAKMSPDGNMFYTSCFSGNYVCRNIVTQNITDAEYERKKYTSTGYSSNIYGNTLYKFYEIPASLYEPAITCMADDAEMFMPESQDEAKAVFQFIPQNVNKIWVGATKYFTSSFTTLQGNPFVTTNWAQGQPNIKYDYVAMNRDLTYETSEYDMKKPFLCRKKIEGEDFTLDVRFRLN